MFVVATLPVTAGTHLTSCNTSAFLISKVLFQKPQPGLSRHHYIKLWNKCSDRVHILYDLLNPFQDMAAEAESCSWLKWRRRRVPILRTLIVFVVYRWWFTLVLAGKASYFSRMNAHVIYRTLSSVIPHQGFQQYKNSYYGSFTLRSTSITLSFYIPLRISC